MAHFQAGKQEIRYQEISWRKTAFSQEISWFCQNWPKPVSSKKPLSLRNSFIDVNLIEYMYVYVHSFLELTDFGQFWQNQEISWENAVFLQEISWYLISCFPARKCATLVPMQILMLYLKISRNMQNTYYLPRASSNRPPFIIFRQLTLFPSSWFIVTLLFRV